MKSKILSTLMAVAFCSQAVFITSCSDDDDDLTPEQREQQQAEKASTFWNIVGKLVSGDDVTDDYQGKTFEPTIGLPDGTNETTRIVNTNDMRTAAQRFADLVDATNIDENTQTYEWSNPEIGSMTYTKGGDPANWATVDVDIKAVPTLQRIIYREGGEGDNGKFDGKAYYRFGDVVSRQVNITNAANNNDQRGTITEYWICVRPAFGPEKKQDSHWVCVNTVSDKNYKYYKASTGTEYWLPTSLNTNKEHMQNFAEMLWALSAPDQWEKNINDHHTDGTLWGFDGLPFFTDFKKANLKLHNQYFWENVAKGWKKADIAKKALNVDNFDDLVKAVKSDGVHLLYKGYSWWFTSSWNCQLWEAVYTNGTTDKELNMHQAVYNEKVERNMKDLKLDVRSMGQNQDNYNAFFNNDGKYRWVIRHATGSELASNGKFNEKEPIQGVKEVYRYYSDVVPTTDLTGNPEETQPLTWGFFRPGVVIQDPEGTRWMCIYSWINEPTMAKSTDQKARFISLDGLTTGTENFGGQTGQFLNNADLVPESQALLVSAVLQDMSNTDTNNDWGKQMPPFVDIKNKFRELYGRSITDWNLMRDTLMTYEGYSDHGNIDALSIFYIPSGGRQAGTQPYFRFIKDGSHVGPIRDHLPQYMKYWYARCFKKYNDGSGQMLDATHLFTTSNYITNDRPVKADKWSICVEKATGIRRGEFTASDRYNGDFDWRLFHNNGYKTAYYDPIIAVRYLELQDESPEFKANYGGKRYTLVWEPNAAMEPILRISINIPTLSNFHNSLFHAYNQFVEGCTLDGELYEPNIYSWMDAWDQ